MSAKQPADYLLSKKKASIRTVPICMDAEVADEYATLLVQVELKKAELRTYEGDKRIERELEDLEAQLLEAKDRAREQTIVFKFRSLGRQAYEDLVQEHPATKKQVDDAKKEGLGGQGFNVETFPIALIAACIIEPKLNEDDVKGMWNSDEWNSAELSLLWECALGVNSQRRVMELGKD